jgi:tetratricopeptide (TPR) repeat protein
VRAALAALLLAACVLLAHWPGERAEFAFDDRDFIEANQSVRSIEGALAALLAPFPPDQPERGLYRPLTSLSYALDFRIGGGDARAFHRSNVLLYLALVALVYRLALAYGRGSGFALALALLFAAHPVHCDAVDAIAGRSELLALLFSLAALLAFLRARREPRAGARGAWVALSAAAYALACGSKETGAMLGPVLAVHALALTPAPGLRSRRSALLALAPHAAVLALYLALRFAALGRFSPSDPLLRGLPIEIRLHNVGSVFLEYLRLLVFPRLLQVDFYYQQAIGIAQGPSARSLAGLALSAAAILAFAALLRGALREAGREAAPSPRALAACALAIFLGFLFPVSHAVEIGALLAERFLLAPSLGFLLLVVLAGAALLERAIAAPQARRVAAIVLVGVLAGLGELRSAARAAQWRDPVALWASAEQALPQSRAILANLAAAQIARGELDAAAATLERSLALDPGQLETLGSLGNLRMEQGRFEEARTSYERVLSARPDDFVTWSNLGVLETRRGRPADALGYFRRALAINPNYAEARRNLEATERALAERAGGAAPAPVPQGSR